MIDSNSCQRKTVGLWQSAGLALYFSVSLYSLTTLVSPKHISEDSSPYPPNSLASRCVQNKIGSSLVSHGPHLWIIPTSSMYPVGPPSPRNAISFIKPRLSHLFPHFYSFLHSYAFAFTKDQNPPQSAGSHSDATAHAPSPWSVTHTSLVSYLFHNFYLCLLHFLHHSLLCLDIFCSRAYLWVSSSS